MLMEIINVGLASTSNIVSVKWSTKTKSYWDLKANKNDNVNNKTDNIKIAYSIINNTKPHRLRSNGLISDRLIIIAYCRNAYTELTVKLKGI